MHSAAEWHCRCLADQCLAGHKPIAALLHSGRPAAAAAAASIQFFFHPSGPGVPGPVGNPMHAGMRSFTVVENSLLVRRH